MHLLREAGEAAGNSPSYANVYLSMCYTVYGIGQHCNHLLPNMDQQCFCLAHASLPDITVAHSSRNSKLQETPCITVYKPVAL